MFFGREVSFEIISRYIMNNKKIAYLIMTISFIFIISGGVSSFIKGLKEDRLYTYERMESVSNDFEDLSATVSVFETYREDLYDGVLKNVYYDTMLDTDDIVKEKISKYETIVDDVNKYVTKLNNLCSNVKYSDRNVNSKCINYKNIYEQIINYFVTDINLYNDIVIKYNNYQKDNNSNKTIKKYKTKKKYIDYNKDGIFDGRED